MYMLFRSKTNADRTMDPKFRQFLRSKRGKRRRNFKPKSWTHNRCGNERHGRRSKTCLDKNRRGPFRRHYGRRTAFTSTRGRTDSQNRRYREVLFHQKLLQMNHIIFWDMDNWSCFFYRLRYPLPEKTFVWGFHCTKWKSPVRCSTYQDVMNRGTMYLQKQSGDTENASDFALMLQVGRLDERLPEHIKFTILSGDEGFLEALHQFRGSDRIIRLINPHRIDWQKSHW